MRLLQLRKALVSLCALQATNRLFLMQDPDEPDRQRRLAGLPALCTEVVDLCEDFLALETTVGCLRAGNPISAPTITKLLAALAKSGFGRETRERAVRLLFTPRLEGLWDSRMGAHIVQRMLDRETEKNKEYQEQRDLDGVVIDNPIGRGWVATGESEESIHPLARVCHSTRDFLSGRKVKLTIWTWKEWLEGSPGGEAIISW